MYIRKSKKVVIKNQKHQHCKVFDTLSDDLVTMMKKELERLKKQAVKDRKRLGDMQKQIDKLFDKLGEPRKKDRVMSDEGTRLVNLLYSHLDDSHHALTHDTDLVLLRDIVPLLEALYPDEEYFNDPTAVYTSVARRFGALLSASGELTMKVGSYYVPAAREYDCAGHTVSRNVWILRNAEKYQDMGPADFYREYERQWQHAQRCYHKQVSSDSIESDVSFL